MKTSRFIFNSLLFVLSAQFVSQAAFAKPNLGLLSLKDISFKSLSYALDTQVKSADHALYWQGEFPTKIQTTLIPALVGVGNMLSKDDEASAFTTASVLGILSQIYLDHPHLKNEFPVSQIPKSLENGISTFSRYESQGTYNFYPSRIIDGKTIRRPINMTLFPLWHGFTNVPNDADTTSVVLSALVFHAKINQGTYTIPTAALETISKFTDTDRSPMFYNRFQGRHNSGAYMTWLYDEKNPEMPRFYFARTAKGERIPFNKNDVDCVVNANILKMLALAKSKASGQEKSCQMLNDMIEKNEHAGCGVYYPNTLNLSFVLGRTKAAGETCISQQSEQKMIQMILKMQTGDGSWINEKNVWQDPIITTAFALDALLHLSTPKDQKTYVALMYGVHFLLKNIKQKETAMYWNAEGFFTATAIARSLIMWQSAAYTNSIISSALLKIHEAFPHYTAKNYLELNFNTSSGDQ